MGLRALYGGRHLRTTIALVTTGVAAGAVTGTVALGAASPGGTHRTSTSGQPLKAVKPRHHPPAPQMTFVFSHRPTPSPTRRSPSPKVTPSDATTGAPAAVGSSAPPSSPPPSAAPTSGDTSPSSSTAPTG